MDDAGREQFDAVVETQVAELPYTVQLLLQETPLVVEDHPIRRSARGARAVQRSRPTSCVASTADLECWSARSRIPSPSLRRSRSSDAESFCWPPPRSTTTTPLEALLEKEIRITILHEIGHHFGLDEDDLEAIGYA